MGADPPGGAPHNGAQGCSSGGSLTSMRPTVQSTCYVANVAAHVNQLNEKRDRPPGAALCTGGGGGGGGVATRFDCILIVCANSARVPLRAVRAGSCGPRCRPEDRQAAGLWAHECYQRPGCISNCIKHPRVAACTYQKCPCSTRRSWSAGWPMQSPCWTVCSCLSRRYVSEGHP